MGREPGGEVVADGDEAAGGGFGLVGADRDEAALQVDRAPVDARHFGRAESREGSEREERNHFGRSRVEQESHLRRCENAGGGFARFDFGEGFGLGGFVFGKVAAGFCPGEKSAHAGVDGVAGSWSAAQAAQPIVDGVAADRENRTGERGGETGDVAFELGEVTGAGSVLAFGGEEFLGEVGNEGVGADAFVPLGEVGGCGFVDKKPSPAPCEEGTACRVRTGVFARTAPDLTSRSLLGVLRESSF